MSTSSSLPIAAHQVPIYVTGTTAVTLVPNGANSVVQTDASTVVINLPKLSEELEGTDISFLANGGGTMTLTASAIDGDTINGLATRTVNTLNGAFVTLQADHTTLKWYIVSRDEVTAQNLATTGAAVNVSASAPPSVGQALIATSPTAATWQTIGATTAVQIHSAYAWGNATRTIAVSGFATFDTSGPTVGSSITPPGPGGNFFTINNSGTYQFSYSMRGTPGVVSPPNPIILRLLRNGATVVAGSQYASDSQTTTLPAGPNGTEACNGFGIATFTAGDVVQLQNWTATGADTVTLNNTPLNGDITINASLQFVRVA